MSTIMIFSGFRVKPLVAWERDAAISGKIYPLNMVMYVLFDINHLYKQILKKMLGASRDTCVELHPRSINKQLVPSL